MNPSFANLAPRKNSGGDGFNEFLTADVTMTMEGKTKYKVGP